MFTMISGWSSKTISFMRSIPTLGSERPCHVVPEDVDLAVVGHQFADKAVRVFDEARRAASSVLQLAPSGWCQSMRE